MSERILLDQMLISVNAPKNMSAEQSGAIVRTLRSRRFQAGLAQAVKQFFRRHPTLRALSVVISR